VLLQSQLDDDTTIFIDTQVAAGFAKGSEDTDFHPDAVLDNVVKVAAAVARKMADAATEATAGATSPPAKLTLSFGIKVSGSSIVSVASDLNHAHFQVTAEWAPR